MRGSAPCGAQMPLKSSAVGQCVFDTSAPGCLPRHTVLLWHEELHAAGATQDCHEGRSMPVLVSALFCKGQ